MPSNNSNGSINPGNNVEANPKEAQACVDYLIQKFDEYCKEHPLQAVDAFMALHNFHKLGVRSIAVLWGAAGVPPNQTYRMADLTFRKAMRDLRQ